ncbi:MAG: alpha-galactosidase, partial [Mariniphaga sp.]|nr:alpha-galactosidase [Mariniphaga sp.]
MFKSFFTIVLLFAWSQKPFCQAIPIKATNFSISNQGLKIDFTLQNDKFLRLLSMLPEKYAPEKKLPNPGFDSGNEVMMQCSGENQASHHGAKFTGGNPGMRLVFVGKEESNMPQGKKIILVQKDTVKNLKVESVYELNSVSPTVRRYTKVTNEGSVSVGIDYLSSAILNNYNDITNGSPEENIRIHYAFNSWQAEAQWQTAKPSEMGWNDNGVFNICSATISNIGSWSSIKYLPMGMIENVKAGVTWFWQIEHNGSWYSEASNYSDKSTYLYLGGPDAMHSQAFKNLKPGETYQTVPVALGCVKGGFDEAAAALTKYRRTILQPHASFKTCPVVFNDYMNCLGGDPTTEKELPLIEAASMIGCNYYVIDAGWYAEKNETWWDAVGLWQPSKTRFDKGLQSLLVIIRGKGMIPGLWLEPEVIGINSPLNIKPDNWFILQ